MIINISTCCCLHKVLNNLDFSSILTNLSNVALLVLVSVIIILIYVDAYIKY